MSANIEFSPSYTLLTIELAQGESIKAEPGAMAAQQGVEMKTDMGSGGLFGGLKRMLGSESFFVNTFTAGPGGGWVSLAPPTPGDIKSHELFPGADLFIQGSSFLGCPANVELDSKFQGLRGLVSGESVFFLRAYATDGPGAVYYNSFGAIDKGAARRAGPRTSGGYRPRRRLHQRRAVLHRQSGRHRLAHRGRRGVGAEVQRQRFRLGADAQAGVADGQADALLAQDEGRLGQARGSAG